MEEVGDNQKFLRLCVFYDYSKKLHRNFISNSFYLFLHNYNFIWKFFFKNVQFNQKIIFRYFSFWTFLQSTVWSHMPYSYAIALNILWKCLKKLKFLLRLFNLEENLCKGNILLIKLDWHEYDFSFPFFEVTNLKYIIQLLFQFIIDTIEY